MPFSPFVPLRVMSAYSLLEGAIEPRAMAKLAKERGFPAIAICDRNGLYGAVQFANYCMEEGVQPITGTLLGIARDEEGRKVDYLPLFAQDEAGYHNLCHLVSSAHLDRPLALEPHIALADLEGRTEGLITFTGAGEGGVTRLLAEGQHSHAAALLARLEALFPGRLYIELARRGDAVEEAAEEALIELAYARDLVTMLRPSLDDVAAPRFPEGVVVRRYRSGDEDAWVEAFNAAFAGHWGGFMGMSAARWAHERTEAAFDPEISLIAWDGDRIAGFCHCCINRELNELRGRRVGMIRYVGVAPAWRRQGLGAALTLAGLHALRDAGMASVALGVDAENVTGARRLYERYGFEVVGEQVMYRAAVVAASDPRREDPA